MSRLNFQVANCIKFGALDNWINPIKYEMKGAIIKADGANARIVAIDTVPTIISVKPLIVLCLYFI